jgi:polysaccharide export outer membrane protein
MTIKTYLHFVTKVILVLLAVTLSSCNRNVLYTTSKSPDSQNARALDNSENALKAIASDDKISLSIWGHDNLSVGSIHTVYSVQEEAGKWLMVDDKGEVNLPQIGKVKLQGLTIPEATKVLEKEYGKVLVSPIINIRILSNKVTVLGEVQHSGVYYFSADKIKLVEMLAMANGLTDYSKSKNIKVIRGKESFEIDLTNIAFNEMIVFPDDVIYVPPTKGKALDRFASKLIPIAALITSIALVYNITNN